MLSLLLNMFDWFDHHENICHTQPVYSYVLGILLCIGGMVSYFPQYYSLIKSKQHRGISELSLFILNIGSACLSANAFILNWFKFECYSHCSFWLCTANLLSMFQITVGWVMVFPLYLIFLRYKIRDSESRVAYDLVYMFIYVVFILVMVIVGLSEKLESSDSDSFFQISAWILGGVISPICSCIVWIPQIVKLIRTKDPGNLSLAMFIMQTPGNAIIIVFQIMYHQNFTTWGTYVVMLVEQGMIVVILLVLKWKRRDGVNYHSDLLDYDPDVVEYEIEPGSDEVYRRGVVYYDYIPDYYLDLSGSDEDDINNNTTEYDDILIPDNSV